MRDPLISLIFPPFCESAFHGPHLAIPLLRGLLDENHIRSKAHDLNISTIHRLIEPDFLDSICSATNSSDYPEHEKNRIRCAIDHLRTTPLPDFINASSIPLKTVLKYAKSLLFPHPQDLEHCLQAEFDRHFLCNQLYDGFISEVISDSPNIICLSIAFSDQLSEAVELARRVRRLSSAEIWLGGSQINLLHDTQIDLLAKSGLFDRISVGNGEQTIFTMIDDHIQSCHDTVVYRSGSMNAIQINKLPFPKFEPIERYFKPITIPVLVTKGCYWGKCTFCDFPKLSNLGGKAYIARDPGLALDEIERAHARFGDIKVNLISDAVPPSWYKKLCKQAIERSVRLNTWSYMMHSSALDESLFELMAEAGVSAINFGTESMIDRILGVMKKQAGYDEIRKNFQNARNAGIRVVANAIPDYPTTTRPEAYLNIQRFSELSSLISSLNPQMFDLTSGTAIDDDPLSYGLNVPSDAYIKSSHGFHSREFRRDDGLSPTDRKIVEKSFARMKWKVLIDRRLENIPDHMREETELMIDGSCIVIGTTEPSIWIMSLGTSWNISLEEVTFYKELFEHPGRTIPYGELKRMAERIFRREDVDRWLYELMNSGVVLGEKRHRRQATAMERCDG